jgi:hypothetical protein
MHDALPECRRRAVGGIAFAVLLALAGAAPAHGQDTTVAELMRKVAAGEAEDGFCANTGWRASNAATNRAFRENAVVGATTVDNFDGGALCATARVLAVFYEQGRKCMRYQWWACQAGKRCGGGTTLTCKGADGEWEDKPQ